MRILPLKAHSSTVLAGDPAVSSRDSMGKPDGSNDKGIHISPMVHIKGIVSQDAEGVAPNDTSMSPSTINNTQDVVSPYKRHNRPPTPPPILKSLPQTDNLELNGLSHVPSIEDASHTSVVYQTGKKQVSWNEMVQFQAESTANITPETFNDEVLDEREINIKMVRQVEGEEMLHEHSQRAVTSRAAYQAQMMRNFQEEPELPNENNKRSGFKETTSRIILVTAVLLLILAIIGLIALGVLYGMKYVSDNRDDSTLTMNKSKELKDSLNLFLPKNPASEPFGSSWRSRESLHYRYILIEYGQKWTWIKFAQDLSLVWHKGDSLELFSIQKGARLEKRLLGDISETSTASFCLSLSANEWYAAELDNPDSYTLFSIFPLNANLSFSRALYEDLAPTPNDEKLVVKHLSKDNSQ